MPTPDCFAVIGATSPLGGCLLELLRRNEVKVIAFSRQTIKPTIKEVHWYQANKPDLSKDLDEIINWICVAPIWSLPSYFSLIEASPAKRVVAISSTSRYTRPDSKDPAERAIAERLIDAEKRFQIWAKNRKIDWAILRPTMIYGLGNDKNITEIVRFIRRWRFFPLLGKGTGLRQPVHVEDVAQACLSAAVTPVAGSRAYEISGLEIIAYRDMITRIFVSLGLKPRFVILPHWCFHIALSALKLLPRFRHWSVSMAERMDRDMVFDNSDARADLEFAPRAFHLEKDDLPS